jgi:hypothetical protein
VSNEINFLRKCHSSKKYVVIQDSLGSLEFILQLRALLFILCSECELYTFVRWHTQELCFFLGSGGVQQIQLRTEGRENRDLRAVAP